MSGIPDPAVKSNRDALIYDAGSGKWIADRVDYSELAGVPATFAPAVHGDAAHDATVASLAAGLVPNAELASAGTADATTFLRGDRTWQAPPGGGGGIPDPAGKLNREALIWDGANWIADYVDYTELTSVPATFPPSVHGDAAHDATVASLDGSGRVPDSELAAGAPAAGEFLAGNARDWRKVDYTELLSVPATFAPTAHKNAHKVGGGDAFAAGDLLDATSRTIVRKNTGADVGARRRLNLIEGSGVTLTVADDAANEEIDVTIAAAAGGGGPATVKITADQTSNIIALADITGLLFALTSGVYYRFEFMIVHRSANAATGGILWGLTFPATTVFACEVHTPTGAAGAAHITSSPIIASGGSFLATGFIAATTDYITVIQGMIKPSASGNLQVRFASETAGVVVTARDGSHGLLYTL